MGARLRQPAGHARPPVGGRGARADLAISAHACAAGLRHRVGARRQPRRAGDRGGGARPAVREPAALRQGRRHAAAAGAGGGAALGAFRHAAARHDRDAAARPRRLRHRLDQRPRGAARGRAVRGRGVRRLPDPLPGGDRSRRAYPRGLPALRADAGRRGGDVGGPQPGDAAVDDADGRADRRAREPDRGERARHVQAARLVRAHADRQGAAPLRRARAARLSRLRAAVGVPDHEHRPAPRGAPQALPPPREGRGRGGGAGSRTSTTSISRCST